MGGDAARALKRPPSYPTKFFGCELGAQSSYSDKVGEGERATVNGWHETSVFQELLDKFIEKYVICPNCHLPEIDLVVKKDDIKAGCKACGWHGLLDGTHKCAAFILKNPPDTQGVGFDADKKEKKSRAERQQERANKKRDSEGKDEDDDDEEN